MSHKMNTDRLKALRDTIEQVTFSRPEEEIIQRYEQLYTGAVNDVMREMCLPDQALPPEIVAAPRRDGRGRIRIHDPLDSGSDPWR